MKKTIFILLSCIAMHSLAMDESTSSEGGAAGAVIALKKTRKKKERDTTKADVNQYRVYAVSRTQCIMRLAFSALAFDDSQTPSETPLHCAETEEQLRVALCECDLDACDAEGNTPLNKAVQCGQDTKALWLLGKGASCAVPNRHGKQPLNYITHETSEDLRIALS